MKDDAFILFFYLILLGVLMLCAWIFQSWSCQSRATQMGIPYQYSVISGCMVKPKGQDWVPLENYRVM